MINVKVEEHAVTVNGHARAGPYGHDIVCAAVSALTETLIKSLESLTENKIYTVKQDGYVTIRFKNLSGDGELLVDSFFIGICGIADSYPDCVTINVK